MPALINFKICDNSEDCNGIAVCPIGAFYWDKEKKTIAVDNSKCISCGKCEASCPVHAIRVARNDEEYKKIKKEIDDDPRKVSDLFIDRYGAVPVHPAFLISENEFDVQILRSTKLAAVEVFNRNSIKCLLHSIPVKELFRTVNLKYRKLKVEDDALLKKYDVKQLPSLLFFKDGKLIDKIEGYFGDKSKTELTNKVAAVLKKLD
jgi:NAD-dependent dihydropyrimidine dehydrogenase PreA subunit